MKTNLSSAFTAFLFIFIVLFVSASADQTLVDETCKNSHDYQKCLSSLGQDPRSANAANVRELARIMLDICVATAKDTLSLIPQLQAKETDPHNKYALNSCVGFYSTAIRAYFEAAIQKLDSNSYKEASDLALNGALGGVNCESGFRNSPHSPLWDRNNQIGSFAQIAQSIILHVS